MRRASLEPENIFSYWPLVFGAPKKRFGRALSHEGMPGAFNKAFHIAALSNSTAKSKDLYMEESSGKFFLKLL